MVFLLLPPCGFELVFEAAFFIEFTAVRSRLGPAIGAPAQCVELPAGEYTGLSMVHVVIMLSLWTTFVQAANLDDAAVSLVFKHADAGLAHFAVLQRTGVTEELDLVVAMGSPKARPFEQNPYIWWSKERKIGLFLQEKTRPGRVYLLGTEPGFEDCRAHIERVTATDLVIACRGGTSGREPNQKWVYDARAKKLLGQFSCPPFRMYRSFPSAGGAVFVGTDFERLVAVEYRAGREPTFRVLSEAAARPWIDRVDVHTGTVGVERRRQVYIYPDEAPPPKVMPPLPRTTYDQFAAARPRRVKDGYERAGTKIEDSIGPWHKADRQIWFGKTFYDSEGTTSVGGFGYFDMDERRLHLFAPPEILDWSVSAILVTPDAVWMALVGNGEYGGSSGGLMRYDRRSGALRRIGLPDIGGSLIGVGGNILAATDFGLAVVEGDGVKRFFIDRTTDGRLRVVPATH